MQDHHIIYKIRAIVLCEDLPFNVAFLSTFIAYNVPASAPTILRTKNTYWEENKIKK